MIVAALTFVLAIGPSKPPPPPPPPAESEAAAAAPESDPPKAEAADKAPAAAPAGKLSTPESEALEPKINELFEEWCTVCHDDSGDPSEPDGFDATVPLGQLIGMKSVATGKPMVVPGKPEESYLLAKMKGSPGIAGVVMPEGDDPLPAEQLAIIENWIMALPADAGEAAAADPGAGTPPARKVKPFHGTEQVVLPTTTTLGKRTLQYRIDHRFGRIGTERGAFGLDAGVVMSFALAYGILDGWDVRVRRSNSRKAWEFGTKYVPLRQENGMPLSLGGYISMDVLADFDVANRVSGNFMLLLSRLWFERWSTMLTFSYHMGTNHNPNVTIDFEDGEGPVRVSDKRGTALLGFASTVWLGKKKRWGIDVEYLFPIPAQGTPDMLYYRGGDADPAGTKIGAWSLGGSYAIGKHFFQVFVTNNREIHPNLAAPGGQTKNPFNTPGINPKNPLYEANFFLGFNLGRRFSL